MTVFEQNVDEQLKCMGCLLCRGPGFPASLKRPSRMLFALSAKCTSPHSYKVSALRDSMAFIEQLVKLV